MGGYGREEDGRSGYDVPASGYRRQESFRQQRERRQQDGRSSHEDGVSGRGGSSSGRRGGSRFHPYGPPSARGGRRSAVDEEDGDGEGSSAGEGDYEAGMGQGIPRTKGGRKASTPRENVRRGLTRTNADGELEWLATGSSDGVPAVRHDDIRPQLIANAEAERVALGVQIEHADEPGPGEYNVTSFYRKHVSWGPKRVQRPEILFDWEEDKETNPRPRCPGYMHWEDKGKKYIVLDPHDNPVKDWDIPTTIASNIPAYKLEAMRRENMSLGHKDFWARMQSRINVGTEQDPVWEELGHPNSVVNMPMERFRFHAGLCSWIERKKTLVIKAGLKKLYGNVLQNNSVRAFGRDLTTKEIKEIKKGDKAVFPIQGDVVPATGSPNQNRRSNRVAGSTKPKGTAKVENVQTRKRKHAAEDEEESSEEEVLTRARYRKRARRGSREESIAAEVDDLVMFEDSPTIVDQAETPQRYLLRSTRDVAVVRSAIQIDEELSDESSADEDFEYTPPQHPSPRRIEQPTIAHANSGISKDSSEEDSAETDDEETLNHRAPFRRIPRAGEVGGKSKGPSWVASADDHGQMNDGKDYRQTALPVSIGGSVHFATYEGLVSNGSAYPVGESGALSHGQAPSFSGVSHEQKESCPSQPHTFEAMMNTPLLAPRHPEEKEMALEAHRKWVEDFLEDEEGLKRVRTEQPVLPLPGYEKISNVLPELIPPRTMPPQKDPRPQTNPSNTVPPTFEAHLAKLREEKHDAQGVQAPEETFMELRSQSVDFSKMPPSNREETQSLIDALLPTREIYSVWTGKPAPRTNPQESYREQFGTIYGAFQDWWTVHHPYEPLPILTGVMHWGRSVDDWIPPVKDSIYYEAYRMGHRARRGGYGQFLDPLAWPGSRLEDAYTILQEDD